MRAAIFRNGDFVVDDIRDPTPSEGQVLVKSLCCGICGSDLHAAKHTPEFVDRSAGLVIVGPWIRNATSCSGMSFAAKW
jgi:threonine dehydrogenase-like Zn-dependent dehydrogenase